RASLSRHTEEPPPEARDSSLGWPSKRPGPSPRGRRDMRPCWGDQNGDPTEATLGSSEARHPPAPVGLAGEGPPEWGTANPTPRGWRGAPPPTVASAGSVLPNSHFRGLAGLARPPDPTRLEWAVSPNEIRAGA